MAEDFEDVKENIDYVSLGKAMKKIRLEAGKTQEEVADILHISRTVYTKYETGTKNVKPTQERLEAFAKNFNVSLDELMKKVSVAIPDTCALLKNKRLLHMLLEDYDQVVVPATVMRELSIRKAQKSTPQESKTAKVAWQVLANLNYYLEEYSDRISRVDNEGYKVPNSVKDERNLINDHKVMALAKDFEKKVVGDVVIIHDDVDFTDYDGKAIRIDDYVAKRSKLIDYTSIIDLDMEFNHLEDFRRVVPNLDLNAYLPDGMTLLISAIKCNDPEKIEERNGKRIPEQKVLKKVRFLLDNGADPNKNDNGRYCLPPLAHSIQTRERYGFDIFNMLLEAGCDFNKAARDERTASYMKVGKLNEGNTPLMIACYHGKKKFVYSLCEKEGISLNQQDSNGYTALIKCAVQRYNRIKRNQGYALNEELYYYLKDEKGADPLIRDRNNHTAEDWMKRGDDPSYKEAEIW